MRIITTAVIAVGLLGAFGADAQQVDASEPVIVRGGQGWSLHSGQTVGAGNNVIGAQLGWPGLSVTFLHGATRELDVGVRLTPINYGFEGRFSDVIPGIKLQGVARLQLLERGKLNLGAEFAPGPMFYFPRGPQNLVGLSMPLKVVAGLSVGSAILLNFGMDLPMFVIFGRQFESGFYLPVLFGGGAEYFIDRKLSVSFNMRMGPSIHTRTGQAEFAMDMLVGVGYRL